MKEIIYVTGNKLKFDVARKSIAGSEFKLVQKKLDTPEIQSTDVREIASFSAKWASDKLQKTVAVSDAGFYIEALNGFPGPFIKYINKWLTPADMLKLMRSQKNRRVEVRSCLGYCEVGKKPVTFIGISKGKIASTPGKKSFTPINEIFIPEGYSRPASDIPWEEMSKFWGGGADGTWRQLAEYLKSNKI